MRQKFKAKYLYFKRRMAEALQKKTERLSVKNKKRLLFLFCFVFAGASILVMVHSITTKEKSLAGQAKMPCIIQQKETPAMPFISKREYERIENFKRQVYLLPKHSFDSFMLARPKLMDSILQIENFYQSQHK